MRQETGDLCIILIAKYTAVKSYRFIHAGTAMRDPSLPLSTVYFCLVQPRLKIQFAKNKHRVLESGTNEQKQKRKNLAGLLFLPEPVSDIKQNKTKKISFSFSRTVFITLRCAYVNTMYYIYIYI